MALVSSQELSNLICPEDFQRQAPPLGTKYVHHFMLLNSCAHDVHLLQTRPAADARLSLICFAPDF
jgi:hypothetical protein